MMGRSYLPIACFSLFAVTLGAAFLANVLPIPPMNGCSNGVDPAWDAAVDRRASLAIVSAVAWLVTIGAAGVGIIFTSGGTRLSMICLLLASVTILPIAVFVAWFGANPCGLS